MNTVIVSGNLGHDAQLRITPGGRAVCDVSLAVREWRRREGQEVIFVRLVIWGQRGETLQPYLTKGKHVLVQGRMSLDQWESNQGEPRSQILVTVSSLEFLGTKPKETDEFEQVVANEIPEPPEEIGLNNAQDANGEDNSELVASGNGSRKRKK